MKPFHLAALAVLALAVVALPAGAAAPEEASQARGITVVGTATVSVAPNVAEWSFGVYGEAANARDALAANAAEMRRVVAAVRAAGVAREDIQTQQVSLYPKTRDDGRTVYGYSASSSVRVTVRLLGRSGRVIDAAVRAGANEVYGPTMTRADEDALYEQALEQAYDEARVKAAKLATKTGLTLGAPVAIREGGSEPGPYVEDLAFGGAERAKFDVEPGQNEIGATLVVTFAAS